jgi:hypothetical protein
LTNWTRPKRAFSGVAEAASAAAAPLANKHQLIFSRHEALRSSLMHFCSGPPTQNCSGVDRALSFYVARYGMFETSTCTVSLSPWNARKTVSGEPHCLATVRSGA